MQIVECGWQTQYALVNTDEGNQGKTNFDENMSLDCREDLEKMHFAATKRCFYI